MPSTLQAFLTEATPKAAADLEAALLRLPEDKRSWCPAGQARTAIDLVAECAILNGKTGDLIETRVWADFPEYVAVKAELTQDWDAVRSLLHENTAKVVAKIGAVKDEDLGIQIQLPWGPATLAQVLSYPYWNMSYHEGQTNYIASMLRCL